VTGRRRRQAGEGGISPYETKGGTRYLIKYQVLIGGGPRMRLRRGFLTRRAAAAELREQLGKAARGEYVEPSKQTTADYLDEWLAGLRVAPSTRASYAKNLRLHVKPHIGDLPLSALTGTRLTKLYRQLEESGRVTDYERGGKRVATGEHGSAGLAPRTVRYIHTILHRALRDAVRDGRLPVNPADRANPPTAKQARAPEMHTWTAEQLRAFLTWSAEHSDLHIAWLTLATTGMRRGELLALRWRDIDLDGRTVSIRRSVGVVKTTGESQRLEEGATKTGKSRVVDLDEQTAGALRAWRVERAGLSLALVRDDATVFGDHEGRHRNPESFSRSFAAAVRWCQQELGDVGPPAIRLHDLRHTCATLMLLSGEPVKVVSERLGHASPSITLGVYAHVTPGMQRAAADRLASTIFGG
jgi:integrase